MKYSRRSKSPKRRSPKRKYVGVYYDERDELLKLPIETIGILRQTSKKWRDMIDNNNDLWCELIIRDFPNKTFDDTRCMDEYKRLHKAKRKRYSRSL